MSGDGGAVDGLLVNHKQFTASSNKLLTSKFRGVCWNKKNRRWQAAINSAGKYIYLGSFTDELDAARQFDRAAIKIRGKKAKLNFPNNEYVDADGNLLEELELPKSAAASANGSSSRAAGSHTIRTSTSSGGGASGSTSGSGSGSPCQPRRRCSSPGPSSQGGDLHTSSSSLFPIPPFKFGPFACCQLDAAAAPMPGLPHRQQQQQPQLLAGSAELPADLSSFAGLSGCSSLPAATAMGHGGSTSNQQPHGIADQAALMLVQRGWSEAAAASAAGGSVATDSDLLGLAPPLMRSNTVTTSLQLPASFTQRQQLQPSWRLQQQQQQQQQDVWRGLSPDAALDCFGVGQSGGGVGNAAERVAQPTVARLLELEVKEAAGAAAAAAAAATAAVAAAADDMALPQFQPKPQPAHQQVQHWEWLQLQGQRSTGVTSLMPSGCSQGGSSDMSGALSHSNSLVTTSLQVPGCCTESQARLHPQLSGLGSSSSSSSNAHVAAAAAAAAAAGQEAQLAKHRRLARSLSGPAAAARASNQQQPQPFAVANPAAGPELRRSVSDGRATSQAVNDGVIPSAGCLSCPLPALSSRLTSCDLSEAFQLARQAAAEQGISDLATALQKMNQGRAAGEQLQQAQLLQLQADGGGEQLLRRASKRARQSEAGGSNTDALV